MKKRQPVGNRLHQLLSLKALGCYGDGGAIFTGDDDLARAMREIRVHGQESRYFHTRVGVGGRMDTLQCVVLLAKLDSFEEEVAVRARIGAEFNRILKEYGATCELPAIRQERSSVHA
jgi:UDP-2-acetamido-2-deoxy-ribo-hexuluronate aminotransferase